MPEYIYEIIILIGSVLAGIIIERVMLRQIHRIAEKTRWQGDDIIISSLRGMIIAWFGIGAAGMVGKRLELQPSVAGIIEKVLLVILIFTVTLVIARISVGFVKHYGGKSKGSLPSASIFANITRVFVFVLGILVILDSLGIPITPLVTALGVGGLAVALALQDTLSNLFAGLHILASRQIEPGQFVKLETGEEGYVVDITWRATTIRQLPNNIVIIPNAKLASAVVTNYYMPDTEMAVLVNLGVSYKSDLQKVETVTIDVGREVMKNVEGGIPAFEPFIRYHTFSDSGINFTVILRAREFVSKYLITHEFIKRVHERYRLEGIEIPFPQRDLHIVSRGKP